MKPQPGRPEGQLAAETPIHPFSDRVSSEASYLIATQDGYALKGCECRVCGWKSFPLRTICPGCSSRELLETPLDGHGSLYSFSTVHVSSSRATPYTIGYVDLDDGVRLLATIAGDPSALSPDLPVRLVRVAGNWAFEFAKQPEAS